MYSKNSLKFTKQLAKNKATQDKLRQEMLRIRSPDKTFEYDTLTENKYLEQVINGRHCFVAKIFCASCSL